ncbi:MAG TPA: cytochrome C oxidase subunit IV family protein [Kofleriaceae bacterium]|nr:cytochrome C oxidase subunit IV family protein [Kofleriaceae bacterium]
MTALSLIVTYVLLVALAAASWLFGDTLSSLLIAVAKTLLIALVFMELRHAHASDRIIAIVAVFFVLLLTLGAFADVVTR